MTSRISYSKLSRENRKRMLGMTIVTVLTFFIKAVFLVMGVNECSSHAEVLRLFRPNMGMAGAVIGLQWIRKSLLFTFQKADRFLRIPSDKESDIISAGSTKQPLYFSDSACCRRSNRICHCAATDFWRRMGNSQFWPLVFVNFCSNMADDGSGNDYDREYYRWYIRIWSICKLFSNCYL